MKCLEHFYHRKLDVTVHNLWAENNNHWFLPWKCLKHCFLSGTYFSYKLDVTVHSHWYKIMSEFQISETFAEMTVDYITKRHNNNTTGKLG